MSYVKNLHPFNFSEQNIKLSCSKVGKQSQRWTPKNAQTEVQEKEDENRKHRQVLQTQRAALSSLQGEQAELFSRTRLLAKPSTGTFVNSLNG